MALPRLRVHTHTTSPSIPHLTVWRYYSFLGTKTSRSLRLELCPPSIPHPAALLPPPPPRQTHPGVVARVELLCHGRDVLHQELVPLPLEGDLVHVDVDSGDVFIATLDAVVLEMTTESEPQMAPRLPCSDTLALTHFSP